MTDKDLEGGQSQTEPLDQLPDPVFSKAADDSEGSNRTAKGQADIETRLKNVEKMLQSGKDKRFSKIEGQLDGVLGLLEGVLPEDVFRENAPKIRDAEWRQRVERFMAQEQPAEVSPPPSRGNAEWEKARKLVQDIFTDEGLVEDGDNFLNSPDYIAFYKLNGGKFEDGFDMANKARQYAKGAKKTPKAVSAAAIAQPPGGKLPTLGDEAKIEEYKKEMTENRGNATAIRAIKQKWKEQGVPVDNIGFK